METGRSTPANVCDHITPHRGDWELFISGPFQSLCQPCHNRFKQIEERAARTVAAIGTDGWPVTDRDHSVEPLRLGPISHPYWFRPLKIPLTIVCGPPASGKSTYIAERKADRDIVLDLDLIAIDTFGRGLPYLTAEQRIQCVKVRNDMLGDLMRVSCREKYGAAWLIASEPDGRKRQWWDDTLKPKRIVVMETPLSVCLQRAASDKGRARAPESISLWWKRYTKRTGDFVVRP